MPEPSLETIRAELEGLNLALDRATDLVADAPDDERGEVLREELRGLRNEANQPSVQDHGPFRGRGYGGHELAEQNVRQLRVRAERLAADLEKKPSRSRKKG